jgi:hypothetical protein
MRKKELIMRLRSGHFALSTILAFVLAGCGGGGAEPSEAQMKDAMLDAMNHPPGIKVSEPVKITFFKKGYDCTFTVTVASANIGASMYNNVPRGVFYKDKDSGNWMMRPLF